MLRRGLHIRSRGAVSVRMGGMAGQHAARGNRPARPSNPTAAAGRGVAIVVLGVVVALAVLGLGFDGEGPTTTDATATTVAKAATNGTTAGGGSTTTPPSATVTTIAAARAPASVTVLVVNGRGVQGAGAANNTELLAKGFNAVAPETYPTLSPTTDVFYAEGYQADALNVAQKLSIAASAVKPLPSTPFPVDLKGAKVVVLLGTDGQGLKPN